MSAPPSPPASWPAKSTTEPRAIRSATLSYQRGRWHVAFSVEVDEPDPTPRDDGRIVGVDLGITELATLSTGEHVPNTRRLDRELRNLRRAQRTCARRRGPDRRTRVEPSNRWRKARARADTIHTRVANLRRNDTHQLTSRLVGDHDVIVIEDLITRKGVVIGGGSGKRRFTGRLADLVRARDRHRCREPYCDSPARDTDHVTRREDGGRTTFENGRAACQFHNLLREQAGWHVERTPDGIRTTTPTGHEYLSPDY